MSVERVVRDGKVAVLISPPFGSGWSNGETRDKAEVLLFHPLLVQAKENRQGLAKVEAVVEAVLTNLNIDYRYLYLGGWDQTEIQWVPVGTRFYVNEYDGYEELIIIGPGYGWVA